MERAAAWLVLAIILGSGAAAAGPTDRYEVAYTEHATTFSGEGTLREGDAKAFRFVVSQPNVTRIEFLLKWRETHDDLRVSRPDTFALTVFAPDERVLPGTPARGDGGRLHVRSATINEMPAGGPARAHEVAGILDANTRREGMGEWRAFVKLEETGNPDGTPVDGGNDFELVVVLHHYVGTPLNVVTLETGAAAGADRADPWLLAVMGLAAAALLLGAWLLLDMRRRRRRRLAAARLRSRDEGA